MNKKIIGTLAAAALAVGGLFGAAPTASAANQDGVCDVNEGCLYRNSAAYGYGSFADFWLPVPTFNGTGHKFLSTGAGKGELVWNNAAHARNRESGRTMRVYVNSNYLGAYDSIPASSRKDLANTKNDNASLKWI